MLDNQHLGSRPIIVGGRAVPPDFLYRIVSALRRVGHEPEARMIAAEALTRL